MVAVHVTQGKNAKFLREGVVYDAPKNVWKGRFAIRRRLLQRANNLSPDVNYLAAELNRKVIVLVYIRSSGLREALLSLCICFEDSHFTDREPALASLFNFPNLPHMASSSRAPHRTPAIHALVAGAAAVRDAAAEIAGGAVRSGGLHFHFLEVLSRGTSTFPFIQLR